MINEIIQKIVYKIILIGDSCVPKTLFFNKLTKSFITDKNISTIGIDRRIVPFIIKNKEGEDIEVEARIIDTAGQERFRSITKQYYKGSQGIILFYNINIRETFDNIGKWLESIKENLGDHKEALIFLMGINSDLEENSYDKRKVTMQEVQNYSINNNIYWCGEYYYLKNINEKDLYESFKCNVVQEIYKKFGQFPKNDKIIKIGKYKDQKKKCV